MEKARVDCVLATSHDNVFYSSGADILTITMLNRLACVFIPLDGEPTLGVHANEEVTARESTWIPDLRIYEGGEWEPLKPMRFVENVLKTKGYSNARIGIELQNMSGLGFNYLQKLLPAAEFVNCQSIFDELRSVKSPDEIQLLSTANMLTAKAITAAFEMARSGDSEKDIARNVINLSLEYGADQIAFMTLGAGANIFELHHIPSNYRLQIGDLLHIDFGCFFKGYLSDISRMAVVGKPDSTQQKAYDLVIRFENAVAAALRQGVKVIDVHHAAKQCYNAAGFSYNRAFIGHGLGIGCHEPPFLGPSHADWTLKTGMFFQIEPSIAFRHVRAHTEDSFVVLDKGAKNVSKYRDSSELQLIK